MTDTAYHYPDEQGHFGEYGGRYVSETLMPLILEVEKHYLQLKDDPSFHEELHYYLTHYAGRPTPLYYARKMTEHLGGAKIYFKRDELTHTGAHKINHCLGQILLAKHMGKKRIIAETGAGQHGVATATVCALFDMECEIYMGKKDAERQKPNLFRMNLLGAKIHQVESGSQTLKDAMNEALRDWVAHVDDTYYLIGTAAGPHPFPMMVRDFQSVIGKEVRAQLQEQEGEGVLPDTLVACIGGGSNALGLFTDFMQDERVKKIAVEAAGKGVKSGQTAASIAAGEPGVLHGNKTYILQDADGQIRPTYSISAGLDYPGIGPEHAFLKDQGRVTYASATDEEALDAFQLTAKLEGILPALEPSHALAYVIREAGTLTKDHIMVVNVCGRGDKDIFNVAHALGVEL